MYIILLTFYPIQNYSISFPKFYFIFTLSTSVISSHCLHIFSLRLKFNYSSSLIYRLSSLAQSQTAYPFYFLSLSLSFLIFSLLCLITNVFIFYMNAFMMKKKKKKITAFKHLHFEFNFLNNSIGLEDNKKLDKTNLLALKKLYENNNQCILVF